MHVSSMRSSKLLWNASATNESGRDIVANSDPTVGYRGNVL